MISKSAFEAWVEEAAQRNNRSRIQFTDAAQKRSAELGWQAAERYILGNTDKALITDSELHDHAYQNGLEAAERDRCEGLLILAEMIALAVSATYPNGFSHRDHFPKAVAVITAELLNAIRRITESEGDQ